MKKLFFATLYILIFYSVAVQGQSNITQNRAWEIVKNDILKGNLQDINVFVSKSAISANSSIKTISKGMYFVHLQKDGKLTQKKLLWVK